MGIGGVGSQSQLAVQSLLTMRSQLNDLQRQLGTGKRSDTYAGIGLDRGLTVGLRGQLGAIKSFQDTITNVGVRLSLADTTLTRINEINHEAKGASLLSAFVIDADGRTTAQKGALSQLDELLALLNTKTGDRYLFSGRNVDQRAVDSLDHILNGNGGQAGFKQIMAERSQADLGNGLGRLVIPAPTATAATLTGTGGTLLADAPGTVTGSQDISALSSAGGTLEINGTSITIPAAADATGVLAAINAPAVVAATGVTATMSGNNLVLTGADGDVNADIGAATSANILTELGLAVAPHPATNLLSQGITQGQALTITIGGNPPLTVTFGTNPGEVSTIAELNGAGGLGGLAGGTASVGVGGNITITATSTSDPITVSGGVDTSKFGLSTLTATSAGSVSIGEDVAGSVFGFKLVSVSSGLTGSTTTAPAGSPPSMSVALADNPTAGQGVTFTLRLPDGTTENLTLRATASATPAAGEFTIGATPAATAANLQAALTASVGTSAQTSLAAASAMAASADFFTIDDANPPMRVAGPPFATATALTPATASNTVKWYVGEAGSAPARSTSVARIDQTISVSYGMRANEQAIRSTVQNIAVFASVTFTASDVNAADRYAALTQRIGPALDGPQGTQTIPDISAELATANTALKNATERHTQTNAVLSDLLESVEGVTTEQVGAQILALNTRLQASMQTTSMLFQMSLVNYI